MAIIRVPLNKTTIQSAVDAAAEGDVIIVRKGVYHEEVIIGTNALSIVADDGAVFVTGSRLSVPAAAFRLRNAERIEIRGFHISGYSQAGIVVQGGGRHRIVDNDISDCLLDGIAVIDSSGNLIWNNKLKQCGCTSITLLSLHGESSGNRLIGNRSARSGFSAMAVVSLRQAMFNDWIANQIYGSGYGLSLINASESLLQDNLAKQIGKSGLYADGHSDTGCHTIIGNELEHNGGGKNQAMQLTRSYGADNTFRLGKPRQKDSDRMTSAGSSADSGTVATPLHSAAAGASAELAALLLDPAADSNSAASAPLFLDPAIESSSLETTPPPLDPVGDSHSPDSDPLLPNPAGDDDSAGDTAPGIVPPDEADRREGVEKDN